MVRTIFAVGLLLPVMLISIVRAADEDTLTQDFINLSKSGTPRPKDMFKPSLLPLIQSKMNGLPSEERRTLLVNILEFGKTDTQNRWVFSEEVTAFLIHAATKDVDPEVRDRAADLLVQHIPASYIRIHSLELLQAAKDAKVSNALLLGNTGAQEARDLIQPGSSIERVDPDKAKMARAKLGDRVISREFSQSFLKEQTPKAKGQLAAALGYVGDATSVSALAHEFHHPGTYVIGGVTRSVQADIIAAMSQAIPEEIVFWRPLDPNEKWFAEIEKWMTESMGTTWKDPRPIFLYESAIPLPPGRG